MGLDVSGDGGWEQAWAGVAELEATAEFGGGDFLVDGGEEVDSGALSGCEGERGELGQIQEGGGERRAGAADDDPLGQGEEFVG